MAMVKLENKMVMNTKDIGLTIKNRDRVKNIGKMVQVVGSVLALVKLIVNFDSREHRNSPPNPPYTGGLGGREQGTDRKSSRGTKNVS